MFATLGFTLALALTRGITTLLYRHGAGANGGVIVGGVHIHHFVFGMVGLLLLAYVSPLLYGSEDRPPRHWFRLTAFAYGVCSALILDEFALWLNLRDVYWERQGLGERRGARDLQRSLPLGRADLALRGPAVWRHLRGKPASARRVDPEPWKPRR